MMLLPVLLSELFVYHDIKKKNRLLFKYINHCKMYKIYNTWDFPDPCPQNQDSAFYTLGGQQVLVCNVTYK